MNPPADRAGDSRSAMRPDTATVAIGHRGDPFAPVDAPHGALSFGRASRLGLTARAGLALLLLLAERFVLLKLAHHNGVPDSVELGNTLAVPTRWRFPIVLSFSVCLFAFWTMRRDAQLEAATRATPLRRGWLALHAIALAALLPSLLRLYEHISTHSALTPLLVAGCLLLTVGAMACLACALAPWSIWWQAARRLGISWLYSGLAAVAAIAGKELSEKLWAPTAGFTFDLVRLILFPFVPNLETDSVHRILYAKNFAVEIHEACSGLEGAGLMLVFCATWLAYFRRDYVFPRALVLLPASLAVIFLLNALRIALLVVIGSAGFSDQAIAGFHSNAGWLTFNAAACGVAFVSRRSSWLTGAVAARAENPVAPYLAPIMVILLTGLLSRSFSNGFDPFYAARLIAGGIAIALCWKRLACLDWRFSWRGPWVGTAVFGIWVVAAQFLTTPQSMPAELAAMSAPGRGLWLATRVLAAVVTVPIAEELAYRGFLMRRIVDADFAAVPFSSVGAWPLLASSLLFGLSHGALWLPGIIAGAAYGLLSVRTGRIGEAVAAHATTNLLLAVWVLLAPEQWQLW